MGRSTPDSVHVSHVKVTMVAYTVESRVLDYITPLGELGIPVIKNFKENF